MRGLLDLVVDVHGGLERWRDNGRSKELHLTKTGFARLDAALKGWAKAQAKFEGTLGGDGTCGGTCNYPQHRINRGQEHLCGCETAP